MNQDQATFPLHIDLGGGWHQVDSGYYTDGHTSVFIVVDNGRAAILDAAHTASTPRILQVLEKIGLAPDAVDYVVISHAHLDHCGGVGSLMEKLPNARCLAHSKATPHLIDPTALIDGAREIYKDKYDKLYGSVLPVDQSRTKNVGEGDTLELGDRTLQILDTPGHTFNHVCVLDKDSGNIFAGDVFGVTLPPQFGLGFAMRIPAAPTQFSPKDWKNSINRIANLGVDKVMLAHYGFVDGDLEKLANELNDEIDTWVEIAREARNEDDPQGHIATRISAIWRGKMGDKATELPFNMFDNDINLNVMGLSLWMTKHLDRYDK